MPEPTEELYDALAARMRDNWPDPTLVKYPQSRGFREPTSGYYVAFFVTDGTTDLHSIGRVLPLRITAGIVDIQIFTPRESTGSHLVARRQADRVRGIFEHQRILTASSHLIHCFATSFVYAGDRGDWAQHNAWTRFEYHAAY